MTNTDTRVAAVRQSCAHLADALHVSRSSEGDDGIKEMDGMNNNFMALPPSLLRTS